MFISPSFISQANSYNFKDLNSSYFTNIENTAPFQTSLNDLNNITEFEEFVDSIITQQLLDYNIVGATFTAVNNGSFYLSKGYGYRKKYPHIGVDPNSTLFRIGSVSKTFTAIAVLQLVEDGLLNLDEDINEYLTAFQIPDTYIEPITLRHILTHTAGFEEWRVSIVVPTFSDVPDVETLLKDYIPARVHPPGEISAYSNYGLGLAAYIVEEISGKAFEDYIYDEIASPLGMDYTSFEQPLPVALEANMSDAYDGDGNIQFFENVILPGAGAGSSSSGDMARLMLALLNNGTYDGSRILNNETVALMFESHFQPPHPSFIPGVGLGLYEMDVINESIIGHEGDTIYFHSGMVLFPEYDFGYFVSYNSQTGGYARSELLLEFIDYFLPKEKEDFTNHITENLRDFDGIYLLSRRLYYKYYTASPHIWFGYRFTMKTNSTHLMIEGISAPFTQISEDFFWAKIPEYPYDFFVVFIRNLKGDVTNFYANFFRSLTSYEKINSIYANNPMQLVFAIIIGIVYIIILAFWGIDRMFKTKRKDEKRLSIKRIFKWGTFGASIFGVIPMLYFAIKSQNIIFLAADTKEYLGWLIALPYIGTVLFGGLVLLSALSWYEFRSKPSESKQEEKTTIKNIEIEKTFENRSKKEKPLMTNIQFTVIALFGIFVIVLFSVWRMYGF